MTVQYPVFLKCVVKIIQRTIRHKYRS